MRSETRHPQLDALHKLEQESDWIHDTLQAEAEEALQGVDFDAFYTNLAARIAEEPSKVEATPVVEQPSFFEQCAQWFQAHQTFVLGTACACAVVGMFVFPAMDKGPTDNADVIVEKILKKRSTRVAVVQTKTQSGQPMTVVVINESGMLTDQSDKRSTLDKGKQDK